MLTSEVLSTDIFTGFLLCLLSQVCGAFPMGVILASGPAMIPKRL